jgi:hypothetical protein
MASHGRHSSTLTQRIATRAVVVAAPSVGITERSAFGIVS